MRCPNSKNGICLCYLGNTYGSLLSFHRVLGCFGSMFGVFLKQNVNTCRRLTSLDYLRLSCKLKIRKSEC